MSGVFDSHGSLFLQVRCDFGEWSEWDAQLKIARCPLASARQGQRNANCGSGAKTFLAPENIKKMLDIFMFI
jgi:hypothetical protein